MAYDLLKLARMKDVHDFNQKLNERTEILTYHSAAALNAFYRGKKLGTTITAEQLTNINNGTFTDIYPGDYWSLPIDGTTTAYVMGFNINNAAKGNHALILLRNSAWKFSMNDTATCEGHFLNSKMYTEHLPYILSKIQEVIPDENILSWNENIGDSIDSSGNVNHRTQVTPVKIGIPSFTNIMGYNVSDNHAYEIMGHTGRWPAFRYSKQLRRRMIYRWIDESANATKWNVLSWSGSSPQALNANNTTVGGVTIYVLPYIHIGIAA